MVNTKRYKEKIKFLSGELYKSSKRRNKKNKWTRYAK